MSGKNTTPAGTLALRVLERSQKARYSCSKGACTIKVGEHIIFDAGVFALHGYKGWKPIHHDLLVLSAAVEFADRYRKRSIIESIRHFTLTVPVFELEVWQQKSVQKNLIAALKQLTGDEWQFRFIQAQDDAMGSGIQKPLPFDLHEKKFAIAYSDGLDSRCVSALHDNGDEAVRVRLTKSRARLKKGEPEFDQIPFKIKWKKKLPESSQRSRGFKFAVITAIAAQLSDVQEVIVPESGQGALSPVLLPLYNVYPDYRSHPVYFRKMEAFISSLLGHNLYYEQPRLWRTKGQTIKEFLKKPGKSSDSLIKTRSCWQTRQNKSINGKRGQCGLCAACLLRRTSMHAAEIVEPAENYAFSDLSARRFSDALRDDASGIRSETMYNYAIAGTQHFQQLADLAQCPDEKLDSEAFELSVVTGIAKEDALAQLRTLLETHAQEWNGFLDEQGKNSFLRSWIEG